MRAIRDPETVKQAVKASVGSTIDVVPGGKLSKPSGELVRGKAYVATISDCRYTTIGPMTNGMRFDVGSAIGLVFEGVDAAVVSGMMQAFHSGQLRVVGFDPADYRIIVVKSAVDFRASWPDLVRAIVDDDPPGIATNELGTFEFSKKNHIYYHNQRVRWDKWRRRREC